METTRKQIERRLENGKRKDIIHMLVVCDTFDYSDYLIYVSKNQSIRDEFAKRDGKNMEKVMEVYSYTRNLEDQLNEHRTFHFD